jgi:peptidoglycan/xylan/chitin deacetylase (PgdA/CDA1 family)
VLLYHRFHPTKAETPWTVTNAAFEDQLNWLGRNQYRVIPLRAVVDSLRGLAPAIAPRTVAITVDDGDHSVYTEMFPIILRHRIPVTLFVYPSAISLSADCVTWENLAELVGSGLVDVQFHTLSHPDFSHERPRRSPADYRAFVHFELTHGRDWIEKNLGLTVEMLAWPYGIYDADLEQAAARAGYAAAFAVKNNSPHEDSIFALPRLSIGRRDRIESFAARLAQLAPAAGHGA